MSSLNSKSYVTCILMITIPSIHSMCVCTSLFPLQPRAFFNSLKHVQERVSQELTVSRPVRLGVQALLTPPPPLTLLFRASCPDLEVVSLKTGVVVRLKSRLQRQDGICIVSNTLDSHVYILGQKHAHCYRTKKLEKRNKKTKRQSGVHREITRKIHFVQ